MLTRSASHRGRGKPRHPSDSPRSCCSSWSCSPPHPQGKGCIMIFGRSANLIRQPVEARLPPPDWRGQFLDEPSLQEDITSVLNTPTRPGRASSRTHGGRRDREGLSVAVPALKHLKQREGFGLIQ